jgi:hypothetical protein
MLMLRRVLVVLAGVLVLGALGAGSAFGALFFPFDGTLAPSGGAFGLAGRGSVAVDDANGDTYVADSASGVVDVFETASGTQLAGLDGSLTPAGSFGGGRVSVAANNATGDVYVLDATNSVVDVFSSAGAYVCQITGRATPSASECNGVAGSKTPAGHLGETRGITVDQATGNVYVVDEEDEVVDIFGAVSGGSGGGYAGQISSSSVPRGILEPRDVAVDDFNGSVFVVGGGIDVVYEFNAAGEYQATWTGANTPAGSFGRFFYVTVAVDNASGDVYVTDSEHFVTDVFSSTGEYLTQFGPFSNASREAARSTTVDQATGRVYVSDLTVVDIFGPGVIIPDVTTGAASGVQPTAATLGGVVNPDGLQLSDCRFEYGTSTAYGQSVPCVPAAASIPADSSEHAVSADLTGLTAGVVYHFRLRAVNANGANFGADATFETPPPPAIDSAGTVNLTATSTDLTAQINPQGVDTTYRFEYGASTAYGASIPVPDGLIAAGVGDRTVTQHVSGLQANTTYHWRVVAQNANGITTGVDHTFIYDTSGGGLPDNRAYEMVTPPQKNGALIGVSLVQEHVVSEDGSRVIVQSVQCFAGSVSCNANRGRPGDPFMFSRTSGGWVTTAMAPPATQFDASAFLLYSADAGTALFSAPVPPGGEDDLIAGRPDGSFLDVGPESPPSAGVALGAAEVEDSAATADLSHVVFKVGLWAGSVLWPFDATKEGVSLYQYVGAGNAAPQLVGVSGGAGSTDLISTCGTALGGGPGLSSAYNSLSADGGTVYFTAKSNFGFGLFEVCSGSGANAGVPVPADTLYARIDGSRTVLISGRSPLGCKSLSCLGSAPGQAEFQGATVDGSRVFFTSRQQLTDNASQGSQNLYEYDFSRPAGDNLVAVSAGDTSGGGPQVQGVIAISSDGSHVYFVAKGVLTGAANDQGEVPQAGAENLYVFERDASHSQGRVAFIAVLPPSDEEFEVHGTGESGFIGGVGMANVTPDGRFLVFLSHGRLTPDDTSVGGAAQVFRYDAQTGALARLSVGERGFNDNGNAGAVNASIVPSSVTFDGAGGPRPDPTMSHDGSFVFFESPVALTPRALNDVPVGTVNGQPQYAENVYEWHGGQVYLISDGRDTSIIEPVSGRGLVREGSSSVRLVGSDATGANVFFSTADRLVAQDTDTQLDYYDAHVCTTGSPCVAGSSAPAACAGEGCRAAAGGPPSLASPVSASFAGTGNLAAQTAPVVKAKRKAKPTKRRKRKAKRKGKKRVAGGRAKAKGSIRSTRRGR